MKNNTKKQQERQKKNPLHKQQNISCQHISRALVVLPNDDTKATPRLEDLRLLKSPHLTWVKAGQMCLKVMSLAWEMSQQMLFRSGLAKMSQHTWYLVQMKWKFGWIEAARLTPSRHWKAVWTRKSITVYQG